jgi:hypothetical protein
MALGQRQQSVYRAIVEADERAPDRRFIYAPTGGITTRVQHPGLPGGAITMRDKDIEKLAEDGYIQFLQGRTYFILTPNKSEE